MESSGSRLSVGNGSFRSLSVGIRGKRNCEENIKGYLRKGIKGKMIIAEGNWVEIWKREKLCFILTQ